MRNYKYMNMRNYSEKKQTNNNKNDEKTINERKRNHNHQSM